MGDSQQWSMSSTDDLDGTFIGAFRDRVDPRTLFLTEADDACGRRTHVIPETDEESSNDSFLDDEPMSEDDIVHYARTMMRHAVPREEDIAMPEKRRKPTQTKAQAASKVMRKAPEPDGNAKKIAASKKKASKFYKFTFTSYNRNAPVFEHLINCICLFFCHEACPTTGRMHWQGGGRWKSSKTVTAISKNLAKATPDFDIPIHVEKLDKYKKGVTLPQHAIYCGKADYFVAGKLVKKASDSYEEFGDIEDHQGRRVDLEEIAALVRTGVPDEKLMIDFGWNTWHQYGRTIDKMRAVYEQKFVRTHHTMLWWFWGETGVGKTYISMAMMHDTDKCYVHNCYGTGNGQWWDQLTPQTEIVVLNEFRGSIKFDMLLQMCDCYRYEVDRRNKGGVPFMPKRVIVNSCYKPSQCYPNRHQKDDMKQLMRRMGTNPDGSYGKNCYHVTRENSTMLYYKCWGKFPPTPEGEAYKQRIRTDTLAECAAASRRAQDELNVALTRSVMATKESHAATAGFSTIDQIEEASSSARADAPAKLVRLSTSVEEF